ncbi:MAG: hypothetical protein ACOYIA_06045 [Eubacteriales bacterium]
MAKKLTSVKSIIYLSVLSVVLIFSLYSLFSDDAKSWFVINKIITVNPIYGRAISSGAGRNISSFKNDDSSDIVLPFGDETSDIEALKIVPGDIIHFIYMISVTHPSDFDNSTLYLLGVYGDGALREDCRILAGTVKVSVVTCTEEESDGEITYNYSYSDTWQTLNNGELDSLQDNGTELGIPIGESDVTGTKIDYGAYAGLYVYLVDIPVLYVDTGRLQNAQKCEYIMTPDGAYLPVEDSLTGRLTIERCTVIKNAD